jgi:hypothetical protein
VAIARQRLSLSTHLSTTFRVKGSHRNVAFYFMIKSSVRRYK